MDWTEERVRALLAEHDFSYQNIELPHGLSTGGADRSPTARRILPDDMTGKSVLDVGSKYGYFCFEAQKRGASRVVGIDIDESSVRKSRLLAECLGVQAEFHQLDIESEIVDEKFDYVLCLNVLHHLRDPIAVLDRLVGATNEKLILEVAALGAHDRRKVKVSRIARRFINRAPIIFVSRNGTSGKRSVQKFFITAPAIENLLRFQRNAFARVDTVRSEHKGRTLSIALRRRIGRLVVVTGPTSVGKSTLIERLMAGELPEMARRVGIDDPDDWRVIGANRITTLTEPHVERLILHYDFLRPHLRSAKTHARDEALDLLDAAREVTFLTLWTPPDRLRAQLETGELARKTFFGIYFGRKRHRILEREYADPARICEHYRNWFRYTRGRSADHVVACLAEEVELRTPEEWEELAQKLV